MCAALQQLVRQATSDMRSESSWGTTATAAQTRPQQPSQLFPMIVEPDAASREIDPGNISDHGVCVGRSLRAAHIAAV